MGDQKKKFKEKFLEATASELIEPGTIRITPLLESVLPAIDILFYKSPLEAENIEENICRTFLKYNSFIPSDLYINSTSPIPRLIEAIDTKGNIL